MNIDERIRHAFDLYSFARGHLEARSRLGVTLPWPADLIRPATVPDEPTEADCQLLADRLRAMLGPDADEAPGPWLKLDATAPANLVIAAADARARNLVDTGFASFPPTEEHQ
jgi:hypothetical protein